MNCSYCNNYNDNAAQYCSQCGKPTLMNFKGSSNTNHTLTAVWLYAIYQIFTSVFYRIINHLVIPALGENYSENAGTISNIYTTTGIIFLVAELVILGIIIAIVKNTSARIAAVVVAVVTLAMFVLDKMAILVR